MGESLLMFFRRQKAFVFFDVISVVARYCHLVLIFYFSGKESAPIKRKSGGRYMYWVTQKLPQICTVILRICIGKVA